MTWGNTGNASKRVADRSPGPWTAWRTSSRAGRAIKFIETYCIIPKGHRSGQPIRLVDFQREWLEDVLAPGVDAAALLVPRGNGKSSLLGALACWGLFDDEGQAQIPIVATTLQQASRTTYGAAMAFRMRCPELENRSLLFSATGAQKIVVPRTGGEMFPISADPDGLQGLDPSLAIADEIGFLALESWDSLLLATGKRPQSLVVAIGTPSFDRRNALFHLQQMADKGGTPPRFRWTAFQAPEDADPDDEEVWRQSNPFLDAGLLEIDALGTARKLSVDAHFRIFRLAQWVDGYLSWLGEDGRKVWDACRDPYELQPGAPTWVGLDVGTTQDCTAFVCVQRRPDDGRLHCVAEIWEPPEDGSLDVADIQQHLRDLADRFDLQTVGFDPYSFKVQGEELLDEGLPMMIYRQRSEQMTPATMNALDMIRNRKMFHDGDALFAQHVLAAQARPNESGAMLSKTRSRDHIDGAVAMCIALDAATRKPAEAAVEPFIILV